GAAYTRHVPPAGMDWQLRASSARGVCRPFIAHFLFTPGSRDVSRREGRVHRDMGAEDDAPGEGGSGEKGSGGFLGLKPAGVKPSESVSKEQKVSGPEKRWGVGDRAPK